MPNSHRLRLATRLFFLAVAATMLLTGCAAKPTPDTRTPQPPRLAVIDMSKAIQAHPAYGRLQTLQEQYETAARQLDAQRAQQNFLINNQAAIFGSRPDEAAGQDAALEQEFNTRMKAKQAEINTALAARAAQYHEQLAGELQTYSDQINEEYQPQIFNLQIKLKTVQLSKEEMTAWQNELDRLQNERAEKIKVREQETGSRLNSLMAPEQAAADQQLAEFSRQLNAELSQRAAAQKAEMDARFTPPEPAPVPGPPAELAAGEAGLAARQQEIDDLQDKIIQDIRDQAGKIAVDSGLDAVLANAVVNVGAVDITGSVIAAIKNQPAGA